MANERLTVELKDCYSSVGSALIFEELGWFLPPYFPLGPLGRLAYKLDLETQPEARQEVLAGWVVSAYTHEHLATMVTSHYHRVPILRDRIQSISESFEAHALGLDGASIVTLLPTIESVLRRHGGGGNRQSSKKSLIEWIDGFIAVEENRETGDHIDDRVAMLGGFRSFIEKRLYADSSNHEDATCLNRHGILHGVIADEEYRAGYNFARLVSVLDLLCFVLTLQTGTALSILGPRHSIESRVLAAYYDRLRASGASRPTLPVG